MRVVCPRSTASQATEAATIASMAPWARPAGTTCHGNGGRLIDRRAWVATNAPARAPPNATRHKSAARCGFAVPPPYFAAFSRSIHAAAARATLPVVADLPLQSRCRPGCRRLPRCAQRDVPYPLRVRGAASPSAPNRPLQRNKRSDLGLDSPADPRGVPGGLRSQVPPPRPRRRLWRHFSKTCGRHGRRRNPHRRAVAMAEPLRRAHDRDHPAGPPRPRDRTRRGTSSSSAGTATFAITTGRELTFRWRRTRPNHGRWSHPNSAALSPCLKSVAFTIATLDELLSVSMAREGHPFRGVPASCPVGRSALDARQAGGAIPGSDSVGQAHPGPLPAIE